MKGRAVLAAILLSACHGDGSKFIERVTCTVDGKEVVYEAKRLIQGHGTGFVSAVGNGTIVRDSRGNTVIEYSAAIPCKLERIYP